VAEGLLQAGPGGALRLLVVTAAEVAQAVTVGGPGLVLGGGLLVLMLGGGHAAKVLRAPVGIVHTVRTGA